MATSRFIDYGGNIGDVMFISNLRSVPLDLYPSFPSSNHLNRGNGVHCIIVFTLCSNVCERRSDHVSCVSSAPVCFKVDSCHCMMCSDVGIKHIK